MRSLHEYLYYLIYEHPRDTHTNACNETEATVASYRNDIIQGEKAQLPKVYYPTLGWKMFVPPLPKYPSNVYYFIIIIILVLKLFFF